MKKIKIVYFIYLKPHKWKKIFVEQFEDLKKSGLYAKSDEIYISAIDEFDELVEFKELLKNDYNKVNLKNVFTENVYEYGGFKTIKEIAEEDSIILYFHSKGMFSETADNKIKELRKILHLKTIQNFNFYLENFEKNPQLDLGGLFVNKNGFVYYNFFWINGDFLMKYCSPPQISHDRFIWEIWLKKFFDLKEQKNFISPINEYSLENKTQVKKIMKNLLYV